MATPPMTPTQAGNFEQRKTYLSESVGEYYSDEDIEKAAYQWALQQTDVARKDLALSKAEKERAVYAAPLGRDAESSASQTPAEFGFGPFEERQAGTAGNIAGASTVEPAKPATEQASADVGLLDALRPQTTVVMPQERSVEWKNITNQYNEAGVDAATSFAWTQQIKENYNEILDTIPEDVPNRVEEAVSQAVQRHHEMLDVENLLFDAPGLALPEGSLGGALARQDGGAEIPGGMSPASEGQRQYLIDSLAGGRERLNLEQSNLDTYLGEGQKLFVMDDGSVIREADAIEATKKGVGVRRSVSSMDDPAAHRFLFDEADIHWSLSQEATAYTEQAVKEATPSLWQHVTGTSDPSGRQVESAPMWMLRAMAIAPVAVGSAIHSNIATEGLKETREETRAAKAGQAYSNKPIIYALQQGIAFDVETDIEGLNIENPALKWGYRGAGLIGEMAMPTAPGFGAAKAGMRGISIYKGARALGVPKKAAAVGAAKGAAATTQTAETLKRVYAGLPFQTGDVRNVVVGMAVNRADEVGKAVRTASANGDDITQALSGTINGAMETRAATQAAAYDTWLRTGAVNADLDVATIDRITSALGSADETVASAIKTAKATGGPDARLREVLVAAGEDVQDDVLSGLMYHVGSDETYKLMKDYVGLDNMVMLTDNMMTTRTFGKEIIKTRNSTEFGKVARNGKAGKVNVDEQGMIGFDDTASTDIVREEMRRQRYGNKLSVQDIEGFESTGRMPAQVWNKVVSNNMELVAEGLAVRTKGAPLARQSDLARLSSREATRALQPVEMRTFTPDAVSRFVTVDDAMSVATPAQRRLTQGVRMRVSNVDKTIRKEVKDIVRTAKASGETVTPREAIRGMVTDSYEVMNAGDRSAFVRKTVEDVLSGAVTREAVMEGLTIQPKTVTTSLEDLVDVKKLRDYADNAAAEAGGVREMDIMGGVTDEAGLSDTLVALVEAKDGPSFHAKVSDVIADLHDEGILKVDLDDTMYSMADGIHPDVDMSGVFFTKTKEIMDDFFTEFLSKDADYINATKHGGVETAEKTANLNAWDTKLDSLLKDTDIDAALLSDLKQSINDAYNNPASIVPGMVQARVRGTTYNLLDDVVENATRKSATADASIKNELRSSRGNKVLFDRKQSTKDAVAKNKELQETLASAKQAQSEAKGVTDSVVAELRSIREGAAENQRLSKQLNENPPFDYEDQLVALENQREELLERAEDVTGRVKGAQKNSQAANKAVKAAQKEVKEHASTWKPIQRELKKREGELKRATDKADELAARNTAREDAITALKQDPEAVALLEDIADSMTPIADRIIARNGMSDAIDIPKLKQMLTQKNPNLNYMAALYGQDFAREFTDQVSVALAKVEKVLASAKSNQLRGTKAQKTYQGASNAASAIKDFLEGLRYKMLLNFSMPFHAKNIMQGSSVLWNSMGAEVFMNPKNWSAAVSGMHKILRSNPTGVYKILPDGRIITNRMMREAFDTQLGQSARTIRAPGIEGSRLARDVKPGALRQKSGAVGKAQAMAANTLNELPTIEDNFFRLMAVNKALDEGRSFDEALDLGRRAMFDAQDELFKGEEAIQRLALFWTWQRNNLINTVKNVADGKWGRLTRPARFREHAQNSLGTDEDAQFKPSWAKGIVFAVKPSKDGNKNVFITGPGMASLDGFELVADILTNPYQAIPDFLGGSVGPIIGNLLKIEPEYEKKTDELDYLHSSILDIMGDKPVVGPLLKKFLTGDSDLEPVQTSNGRRYQLTAPQRKWYDNVANGFLKFFPADSMSRQVAKYNFAPGSSTSDAIPGTGLASLVGLGVYKNLTPEQQLEWNLRSATQSIREETKTDVEHLESRSDPNETLLRARQLPKDVKVEVRASQEALPDAENTASLIKKLQKQLTAGEISQEDFNAALKELLAY